MAAMVGVDVIHINTLKVRTVIELSSLHQLNEMDDVHVLDSIDVDR